MRVTATERIERVCQFLGAELYQLDGCDAITPLQNLQLRARSLAKAAYLRSLSFDSPADVNKLQQQFKEFQHLLQTQLLSKSDQVAALNQFTADLVQWVQPGSRGKIAKAVLKEIVQAESYSVAFHSSRPPQNINLQEWGIQYQVKAKSVNCQFVDSLYADSDDQPWFQALPAWEKQFLKQSIEEGLKFYTKKTPTTVKRPGASNFGRDELSVKEQKAAFYYHSVPSKDNQAEADAVVKDYFSNYKDEMIADFDACYPNALSEEGKKSVTIPVLMESLLTPAWYEIGGRGGDNNTRMLVLRAQAIRQLSQEMGAVEKNGVVYRFQIIDNNQPLNGRRSHRMETDRRRLEAGCQIVKAALKTILNYAELTKNERDVFNELMNQFEKGNRFILRQIQVEELKSQRYALFVETLKAYIHAWKKGAALRDNENHALYLASCESILIQEAGGVVQLNCKSSKDRVGLVKAHNLFLRTRFASHQEVPRYGQQFKTEEAQNLFTDLVTKIPSVTASTVAPGCAGIKDEPLNAGFIAASTVRDIFWWKDNYAKNLPDFFRRANSRCYSAGERFGYGLLGFFSIFLPFLMGPIMRAVSFDAMVPTFATKRKEFKSNKRLAKTNKAKAVELSQSHVVKRKIASLQEAQPALIDGEHETVVQAVNRFLTQPVSVTQPEKYYFGDQKHADLRESLYHDLFSWKNEKASNQGIHSHLIEHRQTTTGYAKHTLVRDARQMKNLSPAQDEKNDAYNYAELAAAYAIAAETIFDIEQLDQTKRADFQRTVKEAVHAFKSRVTKISAVKEQCAALDEFVQTTLTAILVDFSAGRIKKEKSVRYLDSVKNWVAMYQPTVAVSTIDAVQSSHGPVTIVRTEEPLTMLTPALRAEYENRAEKNWYLAQSEKNRRLVDHFMPYILRGHQIPSQLRKYLPGLKNAYKSSVYVLTKDGVKKLSHSNHCAAIVPVIMPDHFYLDELRKSEPDHRLAKLSHRAREKCMREERKRLTQLGLLQQRAVTGSQSNTMVALNSEYADLGLAVKGFFNGRKMELLDREMALLTMDAAKDLHDTRSAKVCLNGWNKIEPNRVMALNQFMQQARRLHRILSDRCKESSSSKITIWLDKMQASIDRLNKAISKPWRKRERDVGAEFSGVTQVQEFSFLSAVYNQVLTKLSDDDPLHQSFKLHEAFYACASGENRTGIVEMAAQAQAVALNLSSVGNNRALVKAMYLRLAQSGHLQYMTGSQGGILGAEGFRDKSMGSLPSEYGRDTAAALSRLHAGYKSADGRLLRGLERRMKKIIGSKEAVVSAQLQQKHDLEEPLLDSQFKLRQNGKKEAAVTIIQTQLQQMRNASLGAQKKYLDKLLLRCHQLSVFRFNLVAEKYLIKHLRTFLLNMLVLAANKQKPLPEVVKQLAFALADLAGDEQYRIIGKFTEADLTQLANGLKSNQKNKNVGMLLGAGIGLGVATLLTGPLASLLALKFAGLVKAKLAVDAVVAIGGASTGRLSSALFDRNTKQIFFARIKDVMSDRPNLAAALSSFNKLFGLKETTETYINQIHPGAEDVESVIPSQSAAISTNEPNERGCFVMTFNLGHGSAKSETNVLSLVFKKNDLQQVRVENSGLHVSAKAIVDFMHQQRKAEIKLTGVLDDSFVEKVHLRAKEWGIAVKDLRENKSQSMASVIHGRPLCEPKQTELQEESSRRLRIQP